MMGQQCSYEVTGKVTQKSNHQDLENSYVCIQETKKCVVTNSQGEFVLSNVCEGNYHIEISHLGCTPEIIFIEVKTDLNLEIELNHHTEELNEAIVHSGEIKSTQVNTVLAKETLEKNSNKSVGELLSQVSGVSSLNNGKAISKPIIHGLSGNRVGYIINGMELTSQQWGNDHAPEIDTFNADHITVVKGVAGLEYTSSAANAFVLVEPHEIEKDPHLHGNFNYLFDTNGRGHTTNLRLSNYNKVVGFSINGTYKKFGDASAPDYYLTNTGLDQKSLGTELEKKLLNNKLKLNASYSYFKTQIGLLAGAYLSSISSFENAITREVPFNTNDTFSYDTTQPFQDVTHHTFQLKSKFKFSEISDLNFSYGYQFNQRSEYDRRRNGRSNIPVTDIEKTTHFTELKYRLEFQNNFLFKSGIQSTQVKNQNIAGTGILPITPNYSADTYAAYALLINEQGKLNYEFGGRLSIDYFNVTTAIREIEQFKLNYTNPTISGGVSYKLNENLKTKLHLGYSTRSPQTNELFSYGLHQGAASFERGSYFADDILLDQEQSVKATFSVSFKPHSKLKLDNLLYVNPINNYTYLVYDTIASTVRGTFYRFKYVQNDAILLGNDFKLSYVPLHNLSFDLTAAYLYGQNVTQDMPLTFMSPNNFNVKANYIFKDLKSFKNNTCYLEVYHEMEQSRFSEEQEAVPPPSDFTLVNLGVSTKVKLFHQSLDFDLKVENLLNRSYRSYLYRYRYFADNSGRNINFRLGYQF